MLRKVPWRESFGVGFRSIFLRSLHATRRIGFSFPVTRTFSRGFATNMWWLTTGATVFCCHLKKRLSHYLMQTIINGKSLNHGAPVPWNLQPWLSRLRAGCRRLALWVWREVGRCCSWRAYVFILDPNRLVVFPPMQSLLTTVEKPSPGSCR